MSPSSLTFRTVLAAFLVVILLGLAGCVQMPADWPAIRPLATVSGLEGTYRGSLQQCAQFTMVFFSRQYSSVKDADGFRLTTVPDGLQVEALSGATVLNTRVIPVQLEDGAVKFEWKSPDPEGSSSSGHFRATLRVNAAGDLVIEHQSSPVGIVAPASPGESDARWSRIAHATQ